MTTRDQTNYAKGYQAALADITACIENNNSQVYPFLTAIGAVERWIDNNTPSKSCSYRGYWIDYEMKGNLIFFRIFESQAQVATTNHLDYAHSINKAKAIIDGWKDAR